jgi:hypothetical protein
MEEDSFSFAFDADYYINTHSDLQNFTAAEATDHSTHFGVAEGRQAYPLGSGPAFAKHVSMFNSILEIAPFCNPTARGDSAR